MPRTKDNRTLTELLREALAEAESLRAVERATGVKRQGMMKFIRRAMETRLGEDSDEVLKVLSQKGITKALAKEALEAAKRSGRFTVFSLVDALTRISGRMKFVGERTDADIKASALLALAL